MSSCCSIIVVASFVVLAALGGIGDAASPPVVVTQCGQRVPGGRTAILTRDLACRTDIAVVLGRGATLDLQGFTLSGGFTGVACLPAHCTPPTCGTGSRCEVRNGIITETRNEAVFGGRVTVRNLMVDGYGGAGVLSRTRVAVFDSQFLNATRGISARRVDVTRSTLINTLVNADRVRLTSTSITNNDRVGVNAYAAKLVDSHVFDNGTSSECGPLYPCADIVTVRRPELDATSTCGTSAGAPGPPRFASWGVCTLD